MASPPHKGLHSTSNAYPQGPPLAEDGLLPPQEVSRTNSGSVMRITISLYDKEDPYTMKESKHVNYRLCRTTFLLRGSKLRPPLHMHIRRLLLRLHFSRRTSAGLGHFVYFPFSSRGHLSFFLEVVARQFSFLPSSQEKPFLWHSVRQLGPCGLKPGKSPLEKDSTLKYLSASSRTVAPSRTRGTPFLS